MRGERERPASFEVAIVHWTRLTGTQCAAAALLCDGDDMSSSLYTLWSGVVVGTPKYIINNIIQQQQKKPPSESNDAGVDIEMNNNNRE